MPNLNIVVGAQPVGRVEQANEYVAQSTIYKGDFLKKNAAGTVERAAAGDAIVGVALTDAAASASVLVADHPEQQFRIQASAGEIDAQTDIGLNYEIVVGTANAAYKRSAMQLDSSTGAATATLALRLLRIEKAPENELGAQTKCIVKINKHQNAAASVAGV